MKRDVVSARELKVRLGTYLRRVRQGSTLLITDRGLPVAELRPIDSVAGLETALARLEARGVVTCPTRKRLAPFRGVESRGTSLSTAVLGERADRF